MKKVQVSVCLLFLLMQSLVAGATGEGEYKLVKKDDQVALYERWVPGAGGDLVREVKAVFEVRSDMEGVINILTDQAKGKEWNVNAQAYKVLHSGGRVNWITYTRYSIPWPFGDQDCCLSYTVKRDTGNLRSGIISFESILHNQFPVTSDVTRIAGTKGKWQLEDAGNGRMKVSYFVTTNRSKKVPRFISDPIVRNNLFSTMSSFRAILERKK